MENAFYFISKALDGQWHVMYYDQMRFVNKNYQIVNLWIKLSNY